MAAHAPTVQGQEKMSKSSPDSAIFMEDTAAEVNKKVRQAFCPPQEVVGNPCIAYMGMIIFPWFGQVSVARSEANGGPKYAPVLPTAATPPLLGPALQSWSWHDSSGVPAWAALMPACKRFLNGCCCILCCVLLQIERVSVWLQYSGQTVM